MKNVILLTIDTLRRDALGCYGNKGMYSPFIDSIQDNCIRFDCAQSTGPYTQAAFPGILTSSYYLKYGYAKDNKKLNPNRVLISEVLHDKGISTAAFHSNAYLCKYFGWDRGWDTFYDSMEESVSDKVPYLEAFAVNKKASAWLATQRPNKPFFLWIHYMDMHEPYIPARKYIDVIDPDLNLSEDEMFSLFKDVILKREPSNIETVNILRKLYLAGVKKVDDAVKEFFGILEHYSLLNDTILIMTADHGEEFNEHGGLSHDGNMYRELIDVPLIIFDRAISKGQVVDKIVSTIDIPPTIVHLFGLDIVEKYEGRSLLPVDNYSIGGVRGEAVDKHGSKEKGDEKEVHFYREGNLKIIYHERDNSWELYDLQSDPKELKNIVTTHREGESLKQKLSPMVRRWSQ